MTFQLPPSYQVSDAEKKAILDAIDPQELTELALALGNIPSPAGGEGPAAQFVYDWMSREGFNPRKVGATQERPNVIGTYGGRGDGANLLFCAHLDTESPTWNPDIDAYKYRPATVKNREWQECWLEDGVFHGYPIANDRGPMSCFLMAAKALKKAGIDLSGKMYLAANPGEIGPEPIEEMRGTSYLGKDIGANYMFYHGGVAPDYAIAAEGCDFGMTWIGCGYAVFRIRLFGQAVFTPLLNSPEKTADHPNPIYRMGGLVDVIHNWARDYEKRAHYSSPGGTATPKAQIAAVRGGVPYAFGAGTEVCALYLEVGLSPVQQLAEIQHSLEHTIRAAMGDDFEVEAVVARLGFEADAAQIKPLADAVDGATQSVLGHPAGIAAPIYSSMWRDHNVFNMQRIPAMTTGFKRWRPAPADFVASAQIYALTALSICGRADGKGAAQASRPVYGDNPFGTKK